MPIKFHRPHLLPRVPCGLCGRHTSRLANATLTNGKPAHLWCAAFVKKPKP